MGESAFLTSETLSQKAFLYNMLQKTGSNLTTCKLSLANCWIPKIGSHARWFRKIWEEALILIALHLRSNAFGELFNLVALLDYFQRHNIFTGFVNVLL